MPTPAIPANTLVTDMVVQTQIRTIRTRFYWEPTVPPTGLTAIEACCDRLMALYTPLFKGFLPAHHSILRFEGRWYGSGGASFEANSTVVAVAGTLASSVPQSAGDFLDTLTANTMPNESALIVQKRTGTQGRWARGRWFFGGLHEDIQNGGFVDPQMQVAVKAWADALSTNVVVSSGFSSTLQARHWDRKNNIMMPITKCYALKRMGTRNDRRKGEPYQRL